MKFCSAYYSDTGKKETNQDSLLFIQSCQPQGDEIVLAVICDGVGGLKRGERASAEAAPLCAEFRFPHLAVHISRHVDMKKGRTAPVACP